MVDIKKLKNSEVQVQVAVPWKEWKHFVQGAIGVLAKEIKVEGFRPGKAPRSLVEQKVGNDAILHEAANRAIRKSWERVIREEKIDVIGAPKAEIKKIAEGNELEYTITTAVMPKASLKKDWREALKKLNTEYSEKNREVSDEDIKREIEKLASSRAKLVTVDRAAKKDDSVKLDFDVLRDGVPIENGAARDHAIVLGSGVFIPGFEEQIEGMKKDEEKEFTLPFPKEYHEKTLAGRDMMFKVKVRAVEERKILEVNDAFVATLGDFKTLDALKKSMREGMEKEAEAKQKELWRGALTDALVNETEVEMPDILVDEELVQMMRNFEGQIQTMGMNIDDYLAQIKKTREEMMVEWRGQAEKRTRANFAIREVAKEQEIKPEAKEVEEKMNKTIARFRTMKDMEKKLDMQKLYAYSQDMLTTEKVFEYLEKL